MFSNKRYSLAEVRFEGREETWKEKPKIKSQAKKPAEVIQEMLTWKKIDSVYFLGYNVQKCMFFFKYFSLFWFNQAECVLVFLVCSKN